MLWNLKKVLQETTLSKSTVYRLINEGDFARPVKISARRIGWRPADVAAWISSRKGA